MTQSTRNFVSKILSVLVMIICILFYIHDQIKIQTTELEKKLNQRLAYLSAIIINNETNESSLDGLNQDVIMLGESKIKTHKAVIAGIVRDSAYALPSMIKSIERLGRQFKDYQVVIYENDSKDGTKTILRLWSNINDKVHIVSDNFDNEKRPSISFLADARNKYIDQIANNTDYNDFDILIVADLDMFYGVDMRGIAHSFANENQWDAVCSNGIFTASGDMWDRYAYRDSKYTHIPYKYQSNDFYNFLYYEMDLNFLRADDLVPVNSCFGGMAIYKREYVKECRYSSKDEDCEHVAFHKCFMNNGGKIYLNPKQVIKYSSYRKLNILDDQKLLKN